MPSVHFSSLLFLVPTVNIYTFYDLLFILFLSLFLLFTIFRDAPFFNRFILKFGGRSVLRFINKYRRF